MARSDYITLIPLDRAAHILGIDPYRFNSIVTLLHPESNACSDVWFQYPYQRYGQAARDDLALALKQTEDVVTKYLRFSPAPRWFLDEELTPEKPYAVELASYRSMNSRFQHKSVRADHGYIIEFGKKTKTLISAGTAVAYSDADGDGYAELATVVVATTVTDTQQVHVYFQGKNGADSWEIRPTTVTISGGNATITFPKYLVPSPLKWETGPTTDDPVWRAIDGDVIGNFVTTVDVYRVYNNPAEQADFLYEADLCCDTDDEDTDGDGYIEKSGRFRSRNSRLGILSYEAATWDDATDTFEAADSCYGDPDKIRASYRAGYASPDVTYPMLQMDAVWERAIVYYALTILDRADNICDNTRNIKEYMEVDLAKQEQNTSYTLSFKDLQNPLGTTRAGIQLWRLIERYRLV